MGMNAHSEIQLSFIFLVWYMMVKIRSFQSCGEGKQGRKRKGERGIS